MEDWGCAADESGAGAGAECARELGQSIGALHDSTDMRLTPRQTGLRNEVS